MDSGTYQKWIEDIDALSEAQRKEIQAILAGRSSEAEVIAALEGRLVAKRQATEEQKQVMHYGGESRTRHGEQPTRRQGVSRARQKR
jgi:hypothetical protein